MNSKIDRVIYAFGVVFLVMLLFAIIWSSATKNSDISNWIMALANVAMAGAAGAAFMTGKRFLSEYFVKEGYALAIRLVNECLMELNHKNKLITEANRLCTYYTQLNGLPPRAANLLTMQARLAHFRKISRRHHQILDDSEKLTIQMLNYGIDAVDARKTSLTTMLVSLQLSLRAADELEMYVMSDFANYKNRAVNIGNVSQPFYLANTVGALEAMRNITINHNKMVNAYNEFFGGERHIQSLFHLKEFSVEK